jgi:membrane-associated progesterone receptor component
MDLTPQQLAQYDGVKDKKLFLALKGVIYDVTGSPFYEPGSGYHSFTGRDASINLAKMSHDEQYYNKYGEITLDQEETSVLNDWVARFESKYHKVGKVLPEGKPAN